MPLPAQASEQINAFIANNRGAMPGLFGQPRRKTPSLFGGDTQPNMPQDGQDAPLAMSAQHFLQSTGDAQAPMNNPRLEQSVMPGMLPAQPQSAPQPAPPHGGIFGSSAPHRPLGGSMREPFNYDQAMQALLPPEPQHSKTHNTLMTALDVAAAMMAGAAGQPYTSGLAAQRKERSNRSYEANTLVQGWKHGDWQNQNEADLKAADPFTIGRDRLAYNPATGQTDNLFHGPADWEAFAASKGLTPGSPEYFNAVDDYVLRSAGPSATQNFKALDDHRTENDKSLESLQSSHRRGLEVLRQGGVSSLETKRQIGRTGLETQRQQGRANLRGLPTYRDTHAGGTHTGAVPTATGPNGQKLQYVGGNWIPLK